MRPRAFLPLAPFLTLLVPAPHASLSGVGGGASGVGGGALSAQVTQAPVQPDETTGVEGRRARIAQGIDAVLAGPYLDRVHWGVLLLDAEERNVLYARNPEIPFVPASNMKIPVTAAALDRLGPAFRFSTSFHATGPPVGGVISGDLILRSGGDPTLTEPFHTSADAALQALSRRLLAAGVRRVEGALVVDAATWDSTSVPTGWMVGNLSAGYSATGGAFSVGGGILEVAVTGGSAPGAPSRVTWQPLGRADFVENRVRTVGPGEAAEVAASYLPESRRWVLEGTLPPGARRSLTLPQRDPVREATQALLRVMEGEGIQVRDGARVRWTAEESAGLQASGGPREAAGPPEALMELARLESPHLMEIVRAIMEPSQNWMAEQLVRALGELRGEGGSWEKGFQVVADYLEREAGADSLSYHFRDASGLAAYNLLTPRLVGDVLLAARWEPWGLRYREAMAEPGKARTTLVNRLGDLRGRVYAKTGTIRHVNALSGYVVGESGREMVFVILTNAGTMDGTRIRAGIDEVVRVMAREG